MASPDLRKDVGQLFAVGFHGHEVNRDITSLIQDYGIGAVVLFKRNVRDASQLQNLCLSLQRIAKDAGHAQPLLIGIDQENGLVTRISPPVASQQPGPMTLGATGSTESAFQVAKATGEMLRYFGINMNYAPVGDVNSEPLNPVIGVRSPGDDPRKVSEFASACARGLRDQQVVPCIKHFPGHGDTAVDSHYGLPVINKSRHDMDKVELVPFQHAVSEGIEMIMTAHISLPELVGSELPATLSPKVVSILRDEWHYEGVIMTDCLEMDGVRATYGTVEASLLALKAGVDNMMICHTYDVQTKSIDRICQAVEEGELTRQRIDESLERLRKLKGRYTNWESALRIADPKALTEINAKGEQLAKQVYADAVTLVRSQPGLLPLSPHATIVFVSPGPDVPMGGAVDSGDIPTRVPWVVDAFGEQLLRHTAGVTPIRFTGPDLTAEEWKHVDDAEVVVLATRNARESEYQTELGLSIARRRKDKPLVGVATCAPYDFQDRPEFGTYIAIYEPTVEAFRAATDVLFGVTEARGILPVAH